MKIVAYHTGGNYERHAAALVESAARFGLAVDVWQLPDLGNWCANCSQKAGFVVDAIERHGSIVYVDADARFRQSPSMLLNMPPGVDFAAHWLDKVELLSGTLYFSGSVASVELAKDWRRRCVAEPHVWDQRHLQAAVIEMPLLNVVNLPEGMCRIFDRQKAMPPDQIFVEHLQASRERVL